ncbi:hypothetical protein [Acinetobacter sp. UBA2581]|uniref:hypothetical protein n=1 Tax=Acinetobacter sp. UBA2581 TaxID=1945932 RepID=UPI00257FFB90|nr:hypothetical protein [Acinetobacter sp. UBA2581]
MKQTQTKLFDFSDEGLDFHVSSKALFPDRFKKMLSNGYNVKTVISVSVLVDRVTLTYASVHGYSANRVLKIDSGLLADINNGEFWIDLVTPTTLTFTLEDAPTVIPGGFDTYIASLGWTLEYESGLVQLYKMRYLDERECYVRFVFSTPGVNGKSLVNVCIGKTANLSAGEITDSYSLDTCRNNTSIVTGFVLGFTSNNHQPSTDSYTYSQGLSAYGKACVVGSMYHLAFLTGAGMTDNGGRILGIFPAHTFDFEAIDYPLVLGCTIASITSTTALELAQGEAGDLGRIGNIRVAFTGGTSTSTAISSGNSISSFLPNDIQGEQTTTAFHLQIYEHTTRQFIGYGLGLYCINYNSGASNRPLPSPANSPSETYDIDLESLIKIHTLSTARSSTSIQYFAVPVEEIKIGS